MGQIYFSLDSEPRISHWFRGNALRIARSPACGSPGTRGEHIPPSPTPTPLYQEPPLCVPSSDGAPHPLVGLKGADNASHGTDTNSVTGDVRQKPGEFKDCQTVNFYALPFAYFLNLVTIY